MTDYSIVQYFPDVTPSDCGYCKGHASISQGMWAHKLTCEDYQLLANRNWRRSGLYCYHPVMNQTCCPQYMIRCDVNEFKASKHQKKIIKRVNRFLMTGVRTADEPEYAKDSSAKQDKTKPSHSTAGDGQVKAGVGPDPNKPLCLKAKELRKQRKLHKLQQEQPSEVHSSVVQTVRGDREKTAHDLLNEYIPAEAVHKLEFRLVRSSSESELFNQTVAEEYEIYKKYQMTIHHDPVHKVNMKQFTRFLVDSPLAEGEDQPIDYGSYHFQYILDGKIIAVEVMDILPECVSSVYFFYDPDYSFINLGIFSAIKSIDMIRTTLTVKSGRLKYYLMGFYIHACVKMRYKAQFHSSYLLCPETYTWNPIQTCLPKLDKSKYSRLTDDPLLEDADKFDAASVAGVTCLYQREIMPYGLVKVIRTSLTATDDTEEVMSYGSKVGRSISQSLLLYRE